MVRPPHLPDPNANENLWALKQKVCEFYAGLGRTPKPRGM